MSKRGGRRDGQRWRRLREGRWTEADARWALAELERSGQGVAAFARAKGLTAQRLHWWRRRLEESALPALVPVEVIEAPDRPERPGVEIAVGPRVRVRVERGFDPGVLAEVVDVLDRVC